MEIDWGQLFRLQRDLDERITKGHDLNGDYSEERLLALIVEVGELANETRCFKYWSVKPPAPREAILEEYVDGIHFILSIGLALGLEQIDEPLTAADEETGIVEQLLQVFDDVVHFRKENTETAYRALFSSYLTLGSMLGFSEKDIELAYLEKNKVNHKRQDEGY